MTVWALIIGIWTHVMMQKAHLIGSPVVPWYHLLEHTIPKVIELQKACECKLCIVIVVIVRLSYRGALVVSGNHCSS